MLRSLCFQSFTLLLVFIPAALVQAQFAGSRGGVGQQHNPQPKTLNLQPEVAQGYITVEGKAEKRVKPTSIRIVLAVTAEAKTPAACQEILDGKISGLKQSWSKLRIPNADVVDDFISVIPRYEFELSERAGRQQAIEKKSGYLMQSNLHVAVVDDAQAMQVLKAAFANEVSDIIAFDYWSEEIESIKKQARAAAVKAAQEKSEVLLAVFDKRPPVINIAESTETIFPKSLYTSFQNSAESDFYSTWSNRQKTDVVRTFRPKNTYYRGHYSDADAQPKLLPMQSEISVVTTVKLYYESPVAKEYAALRREKN